ncbi:NAD(P)-binding protein [Fonsecaea pedrosoi]|nr:NAD(P)-binding protein [Fonsecaea pedrosoi]
MPVAIVTGASRGIGRAIALRLAEDGMDINDLEKQVPLLEKVREEIEQKGRKCLCFVTDITNESQVRQMVKETVDSLGPLTTMVANAGIIIPKSVMDTDLDDFSLILNSHGSTPYAASKWAVRGLTQSMAYDLAEYDINVNGLDPRLVFSAGTFLADVDPKPIVPAQWTPQCGSRLMKSWAKNRDSPRVPDDIAALVSFLAGPGSRNITGQALIVDGARDEQDQQGPMLVVS